MSDIFVNSHVPAIFPRVLRRSWVGMISYRITGIVKFCTCQCWNSNRLHPLSENLWKLLRSQVSHKPLTSFSQASHKPLKSFSQASHKPPNLISAQRFLPPTAPWDDIFDPLDILFCLQKSKCTTSIIKRNIFYEFKNFVFFKLRFAWNVQKCMV